MKLSLLVNQYIEFLKKTASPLTVRNYNHYLNRFIEFISNHFPTLVNIEEINQSIVVQYQVYISNFTDGKGRKLDLSTQAYHLIALRSFLKYLHSQGYKTLSTDSVLVPHTIAKKFNFLNNEQIDTILRIAENVRDRAILEVLLSTGLRVSDLVKLNRQDIDFQDNEIKTQSRSGQKRVLFLTESAAYWLKKYLDNRKDTFNALFIRSAGKKEGSFRLTVRTIQRIVEKYRKKANLPMKITPHSLRHSFAISLLTGSSSLPELKKLLGHKNISTTQIYTHVTNPQLKEIHKRFHRR